MTLILENHRRVHFVGVAGIGMSALARLLNARGFHVSGSDRHPGEQGEALSRMGIPIAASHNARQVYGADLVVVSSAVETTNPEIRAAREQSIPVVKRSELLGAVMRAGRGIAIAGTHGKTTTTALLGWILVEAGSDPTILVGGMMNNLGSNARQGTGDLVIAEADEYDGSFLHLRPALAVITNVEPEHLDFYGTPEKLFDAFRQFASSATEALIVCADDAGATSVVENVRSQVHTYGVANGDTRAVNIADEHGLLRFTVVNHSGEEPYAMQLAGMHNVNNALAAIVIARCLDISPTAVRTALRSFKGAARRMDVKGEVNGIVVIDDYGHHPTEIISTLAAVKQRYDRPIHLVFQPHTYSRTVDFFDAFTHAFGNADVLYLLDIYAARETDDLGMTGRTFAESVGRLHPDTCFMEDAQQAVEAVAGRAGPGDVIVTMGAGDVYLLGPRILAELARS